MGKLPTEKCLLIRKVYYIKTRKKTTKHSKAYQKVKAQMQKENRNTHWKYIEDMINTCKILKKKM